MTARLIRDNSYNIPNEEDAERKYQVRAWAERETRAYFERQMPLAVVIIGSLAMLITLVGPMWLTIILMPPKRGQPSEWPGWIMLGLYGFVALLWWAHNQEVERAVRVDRSKREMEHTEADREQDPR